MLFWDVRQPFRDGRHALTSFAAGAGSDGLPARFHFQGISKCRYAAVFSVTTISFPARVKCSPETRSLLPPMLMCDRIIDISTVRRHAKGQIISEFDLNPDLWFFSAISWAIRMPGCLGMDALWQLAGFFLGWPAARAAAAPCRSAR